MKRSVQELTRPVFHREVDKAGTGLRGGDEVVRLLASRIDAHPLARFVAIYDHYGHTRSLDGGYVDPGLRGVRSLVFCFGRTWPGPACMALPPRSTGVCELSDRFVITFAEAPRPVANLAMERWAESIAEA